MFADRLRELRKAMKLSQFDLARQLNVHQTAVSHWETRRAEPDRAALSRLADFFGVTVDYLLGRDGTKKEPADGELLSREEREHIAILRSMNGEGREKVYEYAQLLADSGAYIKTSGDRHNRAVETA